MHRHTQLRHQYPAAYETNDAFVSYGCVKISKLVRGRVIRSPRPLIQHVSVPDERVSKNLARDWVDTLELNL